MGVILYTHKITQQEIESLQARYPGAVVYKEPYPSVARTHEILDFIMSKTFKTVQTVVVAKLNELGKDFSSIEFNAYNILSHGHSLKIDNKNTTFQTKEEFDAYFKDFREIFEGGEDQETPRGPGRTPRGPESMHDRIVELAASGVVDRKIVVEIEKEFGERLDHSAINRRLPPEIKELRKAVRADLKTSRLKTQRPRS